MGKLPSFRDERTFVPLPDLISFLIGPGRENFSKFLLGKNSSFKLLFFYVVFWDRVVDKKIRRVIMFLALNIAKISLQQKRKEEEKMKDLTILRIMAILMD